MGQLWAFQNACTLRGLWVNVSIVPRWPLPLAGITGSYWMLLAARFENLSDCTWIVPQDSLPWNSGIVHFKNAESTKYCSAVTQALERNRSLLVARTCPSLLHCTGSQQAHPPRLNYCHRCKRVCVSLHHECLEVTESPFFSHLLWQIRLQHKVCFQISGGSGSHCIDKCIRTTWHIKLVRVGLTVTASFWVRTTLDISSNGSLTRTGSSAAVLIIVSQNTAQWLTLVGGSIKID